MDRDQADRLVTALAEAIAKATPEFVAEKVAEQRESCDHCRKAVKR